MSEASDLLSDSERAYMKSSADPSAFKKADAGVPSFLNPFNDRQGVALINNFTADPTSISSTSSTDSRYKHAQHTLTLDSLRLGEDEELELSEKDCDKQCDSLRGVPQAPSWRMSAMAVLWGSSSRNQYDPLLSPDSMSKPHSITDTPDKHASAQHSSGLSNDVKEDAGTTYTGTAKHAAVGMMRAMRRALSALSTVKSTKFIWSKHDTDTETVEKEKIVPKDAPPLRIAPLSCYMEKDSCME
jgi:hypothetical protein